MMAAPERSAQSGTPRPVGRWARAATRFWRDRRGATGVEFAMVASPFILLLFFIIMVGYVLVMGQLVQNATQAAARQLKTGQPQNAGMTQAGFIQNVVCGSLPAAMFECGDIIVNLKTVAYAPSGSGPTYGYQAFLNAGQTAVTIPPLTNSQTSYCPGGPQTYIFLQVIYPVTLFASFMQSLAFATTYQGRSVTLVMGTAAFITEPYNGNDGAC